MRWRGNQRVHTTLVCPSSHLPTRALKSGEIFRLDDFKQRSNQVNLELPEWRIETARDPTDRVTCDHRASHRRVVSDRVDLRFGLPIGILPTCLEIIRCLMLPVLAILGRREFLVES